jgi:YidC/Oxa1 family membrane protein insertase
MRQQDSIAAVQRERAAREAKQAAAMTNADVQQQSAPLPADTTAIFYPAMQGVDKAVVLRNSHVELTLQTRGGVVRQARILDYEDNLQDTMGVTLFDRREQNMELMLAAKNDNVFSRDLYFTPTEQTDSTVVLTAAANNGGALRLRYELGPDYMLHLSVQAEGLAGLFAPDYGALDIVWHDLCRQQEPSYSFESRYATLTYKESDGGTDYLSETSEKIDEPVDEQLDWVAFKSQFFSSVLIAKDGFRKGALLTSIPQEKGTGYLKQYSAKLKTAFDPTGRKPTELEMYFGPNDFRLLQTVEQQSRFGKDLDMEQLVYLGWPLFRWINRWFTLYVFDWLTSWGLNMGIVLILITLLLKAITYPMVKKSYMSSAKMRVLKPKLDEATKQYDKPEDQMQKQQAMMQLYSQYGVSPLSGCLPMLIQMPIWIAMFNFVPNAIQLRRESFLWIDDLSTYDPIVEWGTHIWGIGDHLSLTCILFCVSNVLYSYMTMRQQKDQMVGAQADQMKMMQWMMYLMPLMFFFMFNDYSSGLNFYYFISLFFSAAIMWTLRKTTNDEKLLAILEARYKENKNNPKKQSGLAARLEAMQKQAEELQRQRNQQKR